MEIYFKLKLIALIIPLALSALTLAIIFIAFVIAIINESRIEKFFRSHGYEKRLANVPAYGSGAVYSWVRESDNKRATYKEIKCLSFKQIKEKYE